MNKKEPLCLVYPNIDVHGIIVDYFRAHGCFPEPKQLHRHCRRIRMKKTPLKGGISFSTK